MLSIKYKILTVQNIYRIVRSQGGLSINSDCVQSCNCDRMFSPVCGADKFTHYSACYAGCQNASSINGILQVNVLFCYAL